MIKPRGGFLHYFLMLVMALFIAILIFVWIVTKRANPVILDEHGRPVACLSHPASPHAA